jgi:hypothetical protein
LIRNARHTTTHTTSIEHVTFNGEAEWSGCAAYLRR